MNFIPTRPDAVLPVRLTQVVLGMPHLVPGGLSELWLLRELGHIHWLILADILGQKPSHVTDRQGRRVYAAFRQLNVEAAEFHRAQEDGRLDIVSTLSRLSRTQVLSRHDLCIDGRSAGSVHLVSVFIRRDQEGSNRKVSRIDVDGLDVLSQNRDFQLKSVVLHRSETCREDSNFIGSFAFAPCPQEDFNGAGFLYFSSYIALMQRALWCLQPNWLKDGTLSEKSVSYFGNIDIGEEIRIDIFNANLTVKHLIVRRKSDDAMIAQAIFMKHN